MNAHQFVSFALFLQLLGATAANSGESNFPAKPQVSLQVKTSTLGPALGVYVKHGNDVKFLKTNGGHGSNLEDIFRNYLVSEKIVGVHAAGDYASDWAAMESLVRKFNVFLRNEARDKHDAIFHIEKTANVCFFFSLFIITIRYLIFHFV